MTVAWGAAVALAAQGSVVPVSFAENPQTCPWETHRFLAAYNRWDQQWDVLKQPRSGDRCFNVDFSAWGCPVGCTAVAKAPYCEAQTQRRLVPCNAFVNYSEAPADYLCVVARARNEQKLLCDFVAHYTEEGATRIVILDDGSSPPIPESYGGNITEVHPFDEIMSHASHQAEPINIAVNELAGACAWVLSVDADEFVSTRRHADRTVSEEIRMSLSKADVVQIPWLMFSFKQGQPHVKSPRKDIVYRVNVDKHHEAPWLGNQILEKVLVHDHRILTKPLFRPARAMVNHGIHTASVVHDGVAVDYLGNIDRLSEIDNGMRHTYSNVYEFTEEKVTKALLLTYHYRFIDADTIRKKCRRKNDHTSGYTQLVRARAPSGWNGIEGTALCEKLILGSLHPDKLDTTLQGKAARRSNQASLGPSGAHSEKGAHDPSQLLRSGCGGL